MSGRTQFPAHVVETNGDFLKWGYPQNGRFIMENPINNGWFGGTPILGMKTPMWRLQTLNISKQRGRWLRLSSCCCGYGYGCGLGHRISLHLRRHHLGDLICKRNARRCPTAPYCALLRPTSLRIFNFETSTLAATDVHSHWQHSQHQTMAGICAVRIIAIFCVTVAMAMAGIRAAGITAIICMAMAMAGITGMAVTMTMFLATKWAGYSRIMEDPNDPKRSHLRGI